MISVIVPYRDRKGHLAKFVPWMHNYLKDLPHQIVIVEQFQKRQFNRGKLINVGFDLLIQGIVGAQPTLIVPHDIDMLPRAVDYATPPEKPACLVAVGKDLHHKRVDYFGGVNLLTTEQFIAINGFSNSYWGWGCEDQDMRMRCINAGLGWMRRPGTYKFLPHAPSVIQPVFKHNRAELDRAITMRDFSDGLETLEYTLETTQDCKDHLLLHVVI